jgi:hypothetical protein
VSERTGLGLVELELLAVLRALPPGRGAQLFRHDTGAQPGADDLRSSYEVLAAVERQIGLAPRYAYEVLCDMARPWTVPLRLVDFHGDCGGRDTELRPADPRYTAARLSCVGELVLETERGEMAPLPIGLINGNVHAGGTRPRSPHSGSSTPSATSSRNLRSTMLPSPSSSVRRSSRRVAA